MNGIFMPDVVGVVFLLALAASFALYGASIIISRRTKQGKKEADEGKRRVYACGEDIIAEDVPSASFYRTIIKAFKLTWLRKLHSGDLTEYLSWLFAGMFVLIIIMIFVFAG